MRVAVVIDIVAPYRIPVFNELDRLLDGGLEVFFLAERERRRRWPIHREEIRFRYTVLGGIELNLPQRGDRHPYFLTRPVLPALERGCFDAVVVHGWNHLECYSALGWARRNGRRFVFWSETPLLDVLPRRPLRTRLKRLVVRSADAYAVSGPSAARYLEALGAPPALIHVAPNAVDTAFWSVQVEPARLGPRPSLLYSGRLVPVKGVETALAAFGASRLCDRGTLAVAGDGPSHGRLERMAPPGVRFLGEQDRESLRRLYRGADMLVFPSLYEPWGLVVNEAACAGVAPIASSQAGVTRDLIRDGENGLVVPGGSVDALRAAFDRIADDPELPARLGRTARGIAETNTPAACARGLAAAIAGP